GGVSEQASQFRLKDGAGGGDQDAVIAVRRHGALEMEKRAVALLSLHGAAGHETVANAGRGFRRRGCRQGAAARPHLRLFAAAEERGDAGLGFPCAVEVALDILQADDDVFLDHANPLVSARPGLNLALSTRWQYDSQEVNLGDTRWPAPIGDT